MSQGRNPQELVLGTPRRVLAGFILAILSLVIVGAATLVGLSDRARNVTSVEATFSVLRTIEELVTDVSASQLALAEFVATGDSQLLEPYEKARSTVPQRVATLRQLTTHRPNAARQLDQLEPVLMASLERAANEIAARRSGMSIDELRPLLMEGKGVFDRSVALLEDLKEDTAQRLDEEQRALSGNLRSGAVVVVVGDAILLALVLAAAALAIRDAAHKARAVQFQRHVLAMVGHDLRNPLSIISLSVTQLMRRGDGADGTQVWLGRIAAAANRMERLIRDLLDCSRIELGMALPLEVRKADPHRSCSRIVEDFRAIYPSREIRYEPGDSPEVDWDPDRIEQVLENLLGNALKYSPEHSSVRLAWTRKSREIVIEVENGGAPIPSSLLPHIFEPFRRGMHHDTAGSRKGMGLGLYIVHHIVRQHGGTISVTSSPESTRFEITLPQSSPPSAPALRRVGASSNAPHDVC